MRLLSVLNCLVGVGVPALAAAQTGSGQAVHRLTVGILERRDIRPDSSTTSSRDGVTLGIEEAQRTAKLFGWQVTVVRIPDSLAVIDGEHRAGSEVTAIVGDLTTTSSTNLNGASGPLLLDIGKGSQDAPAACADRTFRLLSPSASASSPGTRDTGAGTREADVAWHPALVRFGAAQLNDRYRKRFGREMDERAWAGWMSIKILVDAALRTRTSDQCSLERFLLGTEGRFDGHKGVPLYFDPVTRELVQPLYAPRPSGEPAVVDIHVEANGRRAAAAADRTRCVEVCR